MSRFIGGGYGVYFLIALSGMGSQMRIVAPWWTPIAVLMAFVPGWALIGLSFGSSAWWTTRAAPLACAVGYLASVASWFLAWTGGRTDESSGTWLVMFPGLAALALVVSPWPWTALLHLAVAMPVVQFANALSRAPRYGSLAVTDVTWGVAFSAIYVLAGIMAVKTGDRLDDTREEAVAVERRVKAQQAQEGERGLYDRLVHDKVLGLMGNAGLANRDSGLRTKARELLRDWADMTAQRRSKRPIDVEDLVGLVRDAVAHDGVAEFLCDTQPPPGLPSPVLPMQVGVAFADAVAEAVHNVRRHCAAEVGIQIGAQLGEEPLVISVTDDGPGFELGAVEGNSLGIARSIVARMADVGGSAQVVSVPSIGTTVRLQWPS